MPENIADALRSNEQLIKDARKAVNALIDSYPNLVRNLVVEWSEQVGMRCYRRNSDDKSF